MTPVSLVRALQAEDAPAILALRREALTSAPLAFGSSVEDDRLGSEEFIRAALADGEKQMMFGHFDAGELTGMVGVIRDLAIKRRHQAKIWGMYVAAHARERGAGHRLLAAAIEQARAWPDVDQVHLAVTNHAPGAQRMYESAGFHVWGRASRALKFEGRYADMFHLVLELAPREGGSR